MRNPQREHPQEESDKNLFTLAAKTFLDSLMLWLTLVSTMEEKELIQMMDKQIPQLKT